MTARISLTGLLIVLAMTMSVTAEDAKSSAPAATKRVELKLDIGIV